MSLDEAILKADNLAIKEGYERSNNWAIAPGKAFATFAKGGSSYLMEVTGNNSYMLAVHQFHVLFRLD